jgi:hypothetical protein
LGPQIGLNTLIACLRLEVMRIDEEIVALKKLALSHKAGSVRPGRRPPRSQCEEMRGGLRNPHRPRNKAA